MENLGVVEKGRKGEGMMGTSEADLKASKGETKIGCAAQCICSKMMEQ